MWGDYRPMVTGAARRAFLEGVRKTALAGGLASVSTLPTRIGKAASSRDQRSFGSIEALDEEALFQFTVYSDHWGHYPNEQLGESFQQLAWLEDNIVESGSEFVLTTGDHLTAPRDGWVDQFNAYVADASRSPDFWRENCYPVIGNHDNQFYAGETPDAGGGIWGAGAPLLRDANLHERSNVTFAGDLHDWYDGAVADLPPSDLPWDEAALNATNVTPEPTETEYYAEIERKSVTVHFVGAYHGAYSPFAEPSRRFLLETLRQIDNGENDIVIVSAHSWSGNFIDHLNWRETWEVLDEADFVLSGHIHEPNQFMSTSDPYRRWSSGPALDYTQHPSFPEIALVLNTGAVNTGTDPGYFEMHVLEDPVRVVAQYVPNRSPGRELQTELTHPHDTPPFVKVSGGPIKPLFESVGGLEPISLWQRSG